MLNIETKVDSSEKLAAVAGKPTENYLFAQEVNQIVEEVNSIGSTLNPDRIISLGTETVDSNDYTYDGYTWQIDGEVVNNIGNPSIIVIPSATVGYKRKDIAVFKIDGTIERVAGTETNGEVVTTPDVPEGTLYFKSYDIDGDTIDVDPEPPAIDGSIFKKKIENTRWKSTQSGSDVVIPFQASGQSHYSVVHSGLTSVAGFSIALLTTPMYEGQDVLFENQTGNAITLKDMFGSTPIKFNLGADLIVPNEGKIWFRFRNDELELIMKSWNDIDLSNKADLVSGKVPIEQLPSYVDDVLEFANLAAFPATGETGKIYVDLSTNLQYRWSGSIYISFSAKEKVIFYNRSTWTFPNVASAPFPLISSTNFELAVANLNFATDVALTAIASQVPWAMPIGVVPFDCKLKRVIINGKQVFASWQGYTLRCVIGSNRNTDSSAGDAINYDNQVIDDFSFIPAVSGAGIGFENHVSTSAVVVPAFHDVLLFMSFARPGISVSPILSTYIEFERV